MSEHYINIKDIPLTNGYFKRENLKVKLSKDKVIFKKEPDIMSRYKDTTGFTFETSLFTIEELVLLLLYKTN
jgi:hypothetical protein